MSTDVVGFVYAATVAAGGIMGYMKRKSIPSLGAGLLFGTVLGYGAYLTSRDPPQPLLQLGTSIALAGIMSARWRRSGKLMPAGFIAILSAAAIANNIYTYNRYLPLPGKS
ncbi:transmembrane protein 14 homolog [Teleopsis dalmanni]|uniref:transmembrane protein 14 homolog n=1 Tax=Teleopsis dalmanni TaxID=139649 RepID=UPI000D32A051|nr:transmembrane protein 14 homolog [Teleopsis dalmanni]XP_037950089.1 transmembrane protein 14 homolog [Teleopsis dalmanni]